MDSLPTSVYANLPLRRFLLDGEIAMSDLFNFDGSQGETNSPRQHQLPAVPDTRRNVKIGCFIFFALMTLAFSVVTYGLVKHTLPRINAEVDRVAQAKREADEKIRAKQEEEDARNRAAQLEHQARLDIVRKDEEARLARLQDEATSRAKQNEEAMLEQQADRLMAVIPRRMDKLFETHLQKLTALSEALAKFRFESKSDFLFPNAGSPGSKLSWRVHLLPYIDQQQLYESFALDQPWDSPTNLKLLEAMPAIYGDTADGKTVYRTLLNVDGDSDGGSYVRSQDVTDGFQETIAVFCAGKKQAVEWTRPDDLESSWTKNDELIELTGRSIGNYLSERELALIKTRASQLELPRSVYLTCNLQRPLLIWPRDINIQQLRALFTHNGNELIAQIAPADQFRVLNVITQPQQQASDSNPSQEDVLANMERIGKGLIALGNELQQNPELEDVRQQLSWRVLLLPHIGEQELFSKFRLREPWHSPNNFALIPQMPKIYNVGATFGRSRVCMPDYRDPKSHRLFTLAEVLGSNQGDSTQRAATVYVGAHMSNYWTRPDQNYLLAFRDYAQYLGWKATDNLLVGTRGGTTLVLPPGLDQSVLQVIASPTLTTELDMSAILANTSKPVREKVTPLPPNPIEGLVKLPRVTTVPLSDSKATIELEDKQLGDVAKAIQSYRQKFGKSPLRIMSPDGTPSQLSWRVHLLPLLDQKQLYDQFAINEPFDSPRNQAAAAQMPPIYGDSKDGLTDICAFYGPGTLLDRNDWLGCKDFVENTAMLVKVPENKRVFWTKPEDVDGSKKLTVADLLGNEEHVYLGLGDGTTFPFSRHMTDSMLQALVTGNGMELLDAQTARRLSLHSLGIPLGAENSRYTLEGNRMKSISMAVLQFQKVFTRLPPTRFKSRTKLEPVENLQLSWRVHILPFLGFDSLFSQFRLKEPWDSPHNRQLIPMMPDVFRGEDDPSDSTTTRVQVVTGKETAFPESGFTRQTSDITDGLPKTLMLINAPKSQAVPWTQPTDLDINSIKDVLAEFRNPEGVLYSTFDGAVHRLAPDFKAQTLWGLITIDGGELVSPLSK